MQQHTWHKQEWHHILRLLRKMIPYPECTSSLYSSLYEYWRIGEETHPKTSASPFLIHEVMLMERRLPKPCITTGLTSLSNRPVPRSCAPLKQAGSSPAYSGIKKAQGTRICQEGPSTPVCGRGKGLHSVTTPAIQSWI